MFPSFYTHTRAHTPVLDFSRLLVTVKIISMTVCLVFPGSWKSPPAAACSEFQHLLFFFDPHCFLLFIWTRPDGNSPPLPLYSLLSLMTWPLFALLVEPQVCSACAHGSVFVFQVDKCFMDLLIFESEFVYIWIVLLCAELILCLSVWLSFCFFFLTFCLSLSLAGNPKGALLTHRNIISNISAFTKITEVNTDLASCLSSPTRIPITFLFLQHKVILLVKSLNFNLYDEELVHFLNEQLLQYWWPVFVLIKGLYYIQNDGALRVLND